MSLRWAWRIMATIGLQKTLSFTTALDVSFNWNELKRSLKTASNGEMKLVWLWWSFIDGDDWWRWGLQGWGGKGVVNINHSCNQWLSRAGQHMLFYSQGFLWHYLIVIFTMTMKIRMTVAMTIMIVVMMTIMIVFQPFHDFRARERLKKVIALRSHLKLQRWQLKRFFVILWI